MFQNSIQLFKSLSPYKLDKATSSKQEQDITLNKTKPNSKPKFSFLDVLQNINFTYSSSSSTTHFWNEKANHRAGQTNQNKDIVSSIYNYSKPYLKQINSLYQNTDVTSIDQPPTTIVESQIEAKATEDKKSNEKNKSSIEKDNTGKLVESNREEAQTTIKKDILKLLEKESNTKSIKEETSISKNILERGLLEIKVNKKALNQNVKSEVISQKQEPVDSLNKASKNTQVKKDIENHLANKSITKNTFYNDNEPSTSNKGSTSIHENSSNNKIQEVSINQNIISSKQKKSIKSSKNVSRETLIKTESINKNNLHTNTHFSPEGTPSTNKASSNQSFIESIESMTTSTTSLASKAIQKSINKSSFSNLNLAEARFKVMQEFEKLIQKSKIHFKKNNNIHLQTQLYPKELGKISLSLLMKDNVFQGQIIVDNEYVQKILEGKLNTLYSELKQEGYELSSISVKTEDRQNTTASSYTNLNQDFQDSLEFKRSILSKKHHDGIKQTDYSFTRESLIYA